MISGVLEDLYSIVLIFSCMIYVILQLFCVYCILICCCGCVYFVHVCLVTFVLILPTFISLFLLFKFVLIFLCYFCTLWYWMVVLFGCCLLCSIVLSGYSYQGSFLCCSVVELASLLYCVWFIAGWRLILRWFLAFLCCCLLSFAFPKMDAFLNILLILQGLEFIQFWRL